MPIGARIFITLLVFCFLGWFFTLVSQGYPVGMAALVGLFACGVVLVGFLVAAMLWQR